MLAKKGSPGSIALWRNAPTIVTRKAIATMELATASQATRVHLVTFVLARMTAITTVIASREFVVVWLAIGFKS